MARRRLEACGAYAITAAPGAALGARTLLALPPRIIEGALGAFFIAMVAALFGDARPRRGSRDVELLAAGRRALD